ncbi:MAG: FecR domain-containing protein [Cyclobacteriaceae bacterium]
MNYQNYKVEDFINDETFVRWVWDMHFDSPNNWDKYLDKFPEKREEMQLAIHLILNVKPKIEDPELMSDAKAIWSSLEYKVTSKKIQSHYTSSFQRVAYSPWMKIAATFLLVAGLAFFFYTNLDLSKSQTSLAESWMVKFNPKGRKSTIMLSDRTKVDLNAQSKIEYIDGFSPNKREITLTGEAFFDVQRDENRPFIINVNGITVKVLGTSFNIKGYPGDNYIQVAVVSGNVEVYDISNNNYVNLVKDEVADYSYASGSFNKSQITDQEMIFGWRAHKLVFNDQDLYSIAEELSRWYGIEVQLEGIDMLNKNVTGVYENASLREVLISLGHNYNFEFELDGKMVRIYK